MTEIDSRNQKTKEKGKIPACHSILVVDDDPVLCELFKRMLSHEHCTVFIAETASEALRIVREKEDRIDVALVDLNLGEVNGLDVLKGGHYRAGHARQRGEGDALRHL